MFKYEVTHYVKELGMSFNTEVTSDLSADEYLKQAKKPPKGLKRPLTEVLSVKPV